MLKLKVLFEWFKTEVYWHCYFTKVVCMSTRSE